MSDLDLQLAQSELTGFSHAARGGDIEELISSMGLTISEWDNLKSEGMVDFLSSNMKDSIDDYFRFSK